MQDADADLTVHFALTRQSGIVIFEQPIDEVFGKVPQEATWDSATSDLLANLSQQQHLSESYVNFNYFDARVNVLKT